MNFESNDDSSFMKLEYHKICLADHSRVILLTRWNLA